SWRFFMSALSDDTTCYGLGVQNGTAAAGTPVLFLPWQGGEQSELWRVDPYGRIISALGDGKSLVLGLGSTYDWGPNGNYIVLRQLDPDDHTQLWSFESDGMIANQANRAMVLNVDGGLAVNGASIITYTVQAGTPLDEYWWGAPVVPLKPGPQWYFIQSGLTDEDNTYGLGVPGDSKEVGLFPYAGGQAGQTWRFPGDGTIVSALPHGLPLGLGLGAPVFDSPGSTCVLVDLLVEGATAQLWSRDGGTIVNAKNQHLLTASVAGAPVVTAPGQEGSPPTQSWTALQVNPLASILSQAPVPFPVFTGGQADAYASINQQLPFTSGNTLREQYVILDPSALSNYDNKLPGLICPDNVSAADWQAVIHQLTAELNAAIPVQTHFQTSTSSLAQMFAAQSGVVSQFISDTGMQQGEVTGGMLSIFESVAYLGMSEISDGGSVVANLMSVGMAIGQAAASATPLADSFQVACSDLWSELNTNFTALDTALGNAAYVILSDWGRLRATGPLTTSKLVGGLGFTIGDNLGAALQPAFSASVMQMLMPAKYMLWTAPFQTKPTIDGIPTYAQYAVPEWGGGYLVTSISVVGDENEYPSSAAMTDIFGPKMNGYVDPTDFWMGQNGWNFQIRSSVDTAAAPPVPAS
ncbi:MAG TPA: hypothetical protein VGB15_23715, partial [Longimicrobium sp.]